MQRAFAQHNESAEGGEVLASDVVRQLVAGKGFLFSDRGDVVLRGFEDPVRLYEVRWREGQFASLLFRLCPGPASRMQPLASHTCQGRRQ